MEESAQLLNLVGGIYDAVLEPARWNSVIEKISSFVGGSGASVFWQDAIRREGNSYYDFGVDVHYRQLYFDKYVKFDPLSVAYLTLDVGDVTSSSVLMPPAELFQTRFYREWAQPQGWIDNVFAILDKSLTSIGVFVVFRHEREGLADNHARRLLRLITPHLRRAVLIGGVIDLKADKAETLADVFDTLSAGVFLVDGTGRIIHANAAGRAILAAGDILRSTGGRLFAGDPQVGQALYEALKAAEQGDAAIGARGVALPLTAHDGEHHVAHLLPLTPGKPRRRIGIVSPATAALFVHKARLETPSRPEAIAKAYKLTPTELRVLLALVEVGSGPNIADALGISDGTVKTHLGHLYQKTGARHQAGLVKLVAGFSNPLIA
jgi:DNA-binding CsgD family transcriptional regulator/PAS domain-containing protein